MKTLKQFVEEQPSLRKAAKVLNKAPSSIHLWVNSSTPHFVYEIEGQLRILGVK